MATLTTQQISRAGITPAFAAVAGGGDACECSIDVFLEFKNTNAATFTATMAIPPTVGGWPGVSYTSVAVVIPATTGDKMIGPINPDLFKDATTGLCQITYTGTTTNGTVGVFKLQGP